MGIKTQKPYNSDPLGKEIFNMKFWESLKENFHNVLMLFKIVI